MAIGKITIDEYLSKAKDLVLIDVRSEGEFLKAHIPGADNMPIFNNEERKIIGTSYKQDSRENAIKLGLGFFGKNMVNFVTWISEKYSKQQTLVVHCWRGGMRSAAMAWLLDLYGYKVFTIIGGYKSYRNKAQDIFLQNFKINIIGGYTGSAKTKLIQKLKENNFQIIDLEYLANHKGSALGSLGMGKQDSQEMFENKLCFELLKLNKKEIVFIEDESQRIGLVQIPDTFFKTMRGAKIYFLKVQFEERLNYLVKEYGIHDKEDLIDCIKRIEKRLGGLETKNAIEFLNTGDIKNCFSILLTYYDKYYKLGLEKRENWKELTSIIDIKMDKFDEFISLAKLL